MFTAQYHFIVLKPSILIPLFALQNFHQDSEHLELVVFYYRRITIISKPHNAVNQLNKES